MERKSGERRKKERERGGGGGREGEREREREKLEGGRGFREGEIVSTLGTIAQTPGEA